MRGCVFILRVLEDMQDMNLIAQGCRVRVGFKGQRSGLEVEPSKIAFEPISGNGERYLAVLTKQGRG